MEEFKLYSKFPLWMLLVYILSVVYGVYDIVTLIIDTEYRTVFNMVTSIIYMAIFLCGLYFIILVNFKNKCYFTINKDGISRNEFNLNKKHISWDSEIYYLITNSFFSIYSYKKMILLQDTVINEHNLEHGYISFKTKDSLKRKTDNKGWICISTKWLKGKNKINDILDMINKNLQEMAPESGIPEC